ncbi:ComF family protein [Pedobacter heparinus]|uniref:ComF family protein n=1 Tax=Pedobacter heparinus TaxID=984 RepID=UPI002931CE4F|nr:phosphoribosyltransferase family protein [Pedobacter heparinus]
MMSLKYILSDLLSLLFPRLCCGCGTDLYRGESLICSACMFRLPYTDDHLYPDNKAAKQLWARLPCNAVMSLLYFKKGARVQQLIHHLKYKGRRDLGIKLGNMIAEKLQVSPFYTGVDLIVPVPLHKSKERLRGYNQSKYIADGIAQVLHAPVSTACLVRLKATKSQTRKGRYQRFENMQTVFSITDAFIFKNKHVLLVDDVMTTGATLEACGMELLACNPTKLSIATVAFAE